VIETEEMLVERAKVDPEAFGILYQQHLNRIYSYIYYRVGNHHDAEDLTACTFHKAFDNLPRYVNRGAPFSAWLYKIAHNAVANWHRSRSRRRFISLDDLALLANRAQNDPDYVAVRNEQRAALLKALRRLPPERQQLLILKFADKLSNEEIGQVMDRTEGAIKSLYHRTLLALRTEMEEQGIDAIALPLGDEDEEA